MVYFIFWRLWFDWPIGAEANVKVERTGVQFGGETGRKGGGKGRVCHRGDHPDLQVIRQSLGKATKLGFLEKTCMDFLESSFSVKRVKTLYKH